jgi:hypothetical protein
MNMADQSMQNVTTDVEEELLNIIIENLDKANMTVEEAQSTAREFLSLLPLQDQKDLLEKLYKLGQDHTSTKVMYLKYAKPIEEEERHRKLALMSEHIKNGQIEHAIAVAKGETNAVPTS